jgi:hypothetical protein
MYSYIHGNMVFIMWFDAVSADDAPAMPPPQNANARRRRASTVDLSRSAQRLLLKVRERRLLPKKIHRIIIACGCVLFRSRLRYSGATVAAKQSRP